MTPIVDIKAYIRHEQNGRVWLEQHAQAVRTLPLLVVLIVLLCVAAPTIQRWFA